MYKYTNYKSVLLGLSALLQLFQNVNEYYLFYPYSSLCYKLWVCVCVDGGGGGLCASEGTSTIHKRYLKDSYDLITYDLITRILFMSQSQDVRRPVL